MCSACERAYALPATYADWPAWAKFMRQEEQQSRRRRDHEIEVLCLSDLEPEMEAVLDAEWYGDGNCDDD